MAPGPKLWGKKNKPFVSFPFIPSQNRPVHGTLYIGMYIRRYRKHPIKNCLDDMQELEPGHAPMVCAFINAGP